jgi:ribosome-associated translation inhibitor RaiA
MQIPLEITFHRMEASDAVEARIRHKVAGLERVYDRIMGCRVIVDAPHGHHHKGKLYQVRIYLTVPSAELAVSRAHHEAQAHEDIYVAIRDAFDAARRRLEDIARRHRGNVKVHATEPHGRIEMLVPERNYGKIETSDGRSIYFHRNSVLDEGYDHLAVGNEVRFVEEEGDLGPQASTVRSVGKHHLLG